MLVCVCIECINFSIKTPLEYISVDPVLCANLYIESAVVLSKYLLYEENFVMLIIL